MFENENMMLPSMLDDEPEFIPLLTSEDEEDIFTEEIPDTLSILPLKNNVLFPGVVIPITVGRDKSIKLIKDAYKNKEKIGVVSQKDSEIEDPEFEDLNKVGTVAYIVKILQMPDGSNTAIIQGRKCFEIKSLITSDPYIKAEVTNYDRNEDYPRDDEKINALIASIKEIALHIIKKSPAIPSEAGFAIKNIETAGFLINFVTSNLNIDVKEKQKILEISDMSKRANEVLRCLSKELQIVELKNSIQSKVKHDLDKQQRDYFLNQQIRTIQEELGGTPDQQEIEEIKKKAEGKKWSEKILNLFEKEVVKLQRMNPAAAEYSVQMNYVETLVDMPWGEYTKDDLDMDKAQDVLDRDHFGLEKVKERIIEYLAVLKLRGDMKSPILCLVGPPGVGKTSLGKSVAESINRKYIRMSLGGLRDEAEIRGHRKTYIGAMPGRVVQSIKKAGSANPVFVLDEIDKVGTGNVNGDPSAALLEVLDPEQNNAFYDNFMEVEFDLSKVMFIATANTTNTIHSALLDRMEIIDISGYLLEEKIEIAKKHLIPRQLKEHGVKKGQLQYNKKVLETLVKDYTRESGVRSLEKVIAKTIRNRAKLIAGEKEFDKKLSLEDITTILGAPRFSREDINACGIPGVITGLAWTSVGGEILCIEANLTKGKGKLTLTGNLGDVMKESATLAYEYLKSHYEFLSINQDDLDNHNVHIHVPEGATPKDGPSAGITMFTALASAFTQRPAKKGFAMTGEITLRGRVLIIGGVKEKILAAKRSGIKNIILPEENRKDILDIKEDYLKGLTFHYAKEMKDVIDLVLSK